MSDYDKKLRPHVYEAAEKMFRDNPSYDNIGDAID